MTCAALTLAILSHQHASQMGVVTNGAVMTLVVRRGFDACWKCSTRTRRAARLPSFGTASDSSTARVRRGGAAGALTAYVANTTGGAFPGTSPPFPVAVVTMILSVSNAPGSARSPPRETMRARVFVCL